MRLIRLSLRNWRGVASREIRFGEGVTLVEGPNEIGKSTIVEAIQLLFRELDSSKKKDVKAIQPVGEDVGSQVEAEVRAGVHHFVYAKTYNKSPQTTLEILAPQQRQLTGREAHETVEQLLEQTVDMALWDALLVDQGEKVGLANLQSSAGLARALDEAAGNAGDADLAEESSLFAAAQAEYERYFTAKTGRSRYSGLEEAFADAEAELLAARVALTEVEDNADQQQRQATEVRRLRAALPDLEGSLQAHEAHWQTVRSLAEKVSGKRKELESARTIQLEAGRTLQARRELVTQIEESGKRAQLERDRQAPLTSQTEALQAEIARANQALIERKGAVRSARQRLELTQADATHLDNIDKLTAAQQRLRQLVEISERLKVQLEIRSSIKVDDAGLEKIRRAVIAVDVAQGKRNAAATTLSVTADAGLELQIDGEAVSLGASETETRAVSSELEVRLPDVASIRVIPSLSVAELVEESREAEEALEELTSRFEVPNLEAAVAANQRRADAQRGIEALKIREQEILQSASHEEIGQSVTSLQEAVDGYVRQRLSDEALPDNALVAGDRAFAARALLNDRERALEEDQEKTAQLTREHATLDGRLRIAQQELAGLQAALADKQSALERARAERTDDSLEEAAGQATQAAETLGAEVVALDANLAEASPDAAEALVKNGRAVLERARSDLVDAERNMAILTDRLEQAQADGRFEAKESAERAFEESRSRLESTRRRAEASELLWSTLNRHRDAAREAYVLPLKQAIERLGAIVFGAGFEVQVGDDWSIVSRTLNGKTLPFDDLSVGAREQLGILTRLAAAQIVSSQGGVPLIIDDALGFSDPARLETMGAAIAAAGRECQIIILTCTPGRFTHVGSAQVERLAMS